MEGVWIVGYDGYCNLCSHAVRWIRRNDRKQRFRLVPLQQMDGVQYHTAANPVAQSKNNHQPPSGSPDTVLLFMNGKVYDRSAAVLNIARHLRFPWPVLAVFLLVPQFLRDPVYDLVARNRKRWFGARSELC